MYDTLDDHPIAVFHAAKQATSSPLRDLSHKIRLEAFGPTITELQWLAWIDEAEALFGHSLDGDQALDGYSLDYAYDAYRDGLTPVEYWQGVTA